ncbi:MAG: penicillin-binding protein 1A [Flavobacteriales bacterium]
MKIKEKLEPILNRIKPILVNIKSTKVYSFIAEKLKSTDKNGKVNWTKRIILAIWCMVSAPFIVIGFGVFFASMGWFGDLPDIEDIEHPENNFASQVLSYDGKELGKYYFENRTPVSYEELSPHLVNALIATEDERFREHSGIDWYAIARAISNAAVGRNAGGGSTITQQLAKMLFTGERSKSKIGRVQQKFKEWVISARLERHYTKNEIIAMYYNKFDFLYQAVGIKSAAKIYFDKLPKDLDRQESAILVGMAKNPGLFNPKKSLDRENDRALNRRNTVFGQMLRNELINQEEFDSLKALPLTIDYHKESHVTGSSTYFREFLRKELKKWIKTTKKPNGDDYNIYTDGLKIYTTIDSRIQKYAEQAVNKHNKVLQEQMYNHMKWRKKAPWPWDYTKKKIADNLERTKKQSDRYRKMKKAGVSEENIDKAFDEKVDMELYTMHGIVDTLLTPNDSILHNKYLLHHSLMSMDPQTGFIKAWVGGIDYKFFKYDNVKLGKRQVGSTFKPLVYATAIDQLKFSPCEEVPNIPVTIEKGMYGLLRDWTPKNAGGKKGGVVSLKYGLANSMNNITAFLMKKVGPEKVIKMARRMGITSDIPRVPSICLGTPDISLYEMVGAYGTFANKGIYTEPIFITKIEDRNGTIIYQYQPETTAVLSEEKAYTVVNLMEGVSKFGTGTRLRGRKYGFKNPIAGKTGTTQNNMDGWFMGMVPNLVTGVWTGCQDAAVRFSSTKYGQGANMALPIWGEMMKSIYADKSLDISSGKFEKPSGKMEIELDCKKYNEAQFGEDGEDPSDPEF